ncbi:MAG: GGDEF domain-containing protein, partial [Sphaerochaetaceae bacterium]|nr:GGDEF domain-containing protein [Sphaerochaetaceae bacterium]
VDHFKRINDQYGHLAGDHLLKMLAQLATEHFTSDELIARFGGDEFVILLCSALNETVEKAESFRLAVKSQRIKFDNYELTMTVSIGISELTTLDNDGTNIITRADKALYRAKQQGRNRVQWG